MAQQSKKREVADTQAQDNLVSMQDTNKEKQVLEINKQMSSLEGSIDNLNKKLNTTNRQIKSDVNRLSDADTDISEKVAETYKQLGLIETTFRDLSKESQKINSDLKKVNKTIRDFEKSSQAALDTAIENQSEINAGFKQAHDDLIERAEKLSKKATSISKKLDKSIKDNSKALTELEEKIVSELENIAQSSEDRDNKLADDIKTANDEISSHKAKILMMQSVDEALDKRAATLEQTSEKLLQDSESLKRSTKALNDLTKKLVGDVEALEIHTAQLTEQNKEQQGLIDLLQDKTESLGRSLLALATLEKKHFRVLGSASLLLLIALIGSVIYSEYMRDTENAVEVQRNTQVNEQITDLQSRVQDEQMASHVFYDEISSLQSNVNQLQQKMQGMNDQVESLDGRVRYMAPLYNFGTDNTIHGSHWLSKLDENLYSIKVATVSDKQALYEIAQRNSYYFTEDLAYFDTKDGQYTLVYGGKFNNENEINDLLRRMPRYMKNQQLGSISNAEILRLIQQ